MEERLRPLLTDGPLLGRPFIGLHIRYSDNIRNFENDFGRDPAVTRSLKHYMQIANDIRKTTGITDIYVATDSVYMLQDLLRNFSNEWTIHVQDRVPRTKTQDWVWYRDSRSSSAPAIAADVEMLRRADYVIGAAQSNVYRLIMELNMAYHAGTYLWTTNRHRIVDIEWYEDP